MEAARTVKHPEAAKWARRSASRARQSPARGRSGHQRPHSTRRLNDTPDPATLNHMVEQDLNHIFHALSNPTRRAILARLASGETTVGDLSQPLPLSFAGVSKHLGVLERANLVTREARGRERVCRLNPAALRDAQDWLEFHTRFWTERLDALGALVEPGADDEGEQR